MRPLMRPLCPLALWQGCLLLAALVRASVPRMSPPSGPPSTVRPPPSPPPPSPPLPPRLIPAQRALSREPVYIALTAARLNLTSDEPDVEIRRPSNVEQWKTKVIIVCTVTATLEIIVVLIIVIYWRQIRWSLRKLACPCDPSSRRRRRQQQRHHQAMTRTNGDRRRVHSDSSDTSDHLPHDPDSGSELSDGQEVHTYAVPSTSRGVTGDRQQAYIIHALGRLPDSDSEDDMSITIHTTAGL